MALLYFFCIYQETLKEMNEMTAKRQKRGKVEEERTVEEKTTLHVKDPTDYQVVPNFCKGCLIAKELK